MLFRFRRVFRFGQERRTGLVRRAMDVRRVAIRPRGPVEPDVLTQVQVGLAEGAVRGLEEPPQVLARLLALLELGLEFGHPGLRAHHAAELAEGDAGQGPDEHADRDEAVLGVLNSGNPDQALSVEPTQ